MRTWQMITNNGSLMREPTAELRTTEMPRLRHLGLPDMDLGYRYESCMFFSNGNSEVMDRYQDQGDALLGHHRLCDRCGLTRRVL